MLAEIRNANSYVLLEMYLFESGDVANRFIKVLTDAVARNITVCLLLDDYGSQHLLEEDREILIAAGVLLVFYNPLSFRKFRGNISRDHRKILIIDGKITFVGGAGIADEFETSESAPYFWRDNMLKITGPNVADWQKVFLESWHHCQTQTLNLPMPEIRVNQGSPRGRVRVNYPPLRTEGKKSLLNQIRKAKQRVWITTAYFVPTWKLRRALRRAAKKGLDVRLLLPGRNTDHAWVRQLGQREYARLLRHGIRIFEYQSGFTHSKVALCDSWAMLGSSNMDRWNLRWNLEADQEVEDSAFADEVALMMQSDFSNSIEINHEIWRQRSRFKRFREWIAGKIAALLQYFSG